MSTITDEYMREHLQSTRPYTVVILRKTPRFQTTPNVDKIVWEHGRRNFQLRKDGKLCVVCAIRDQTDVGGVGIFAGDLEETRRIMEGDPAVMAGILSFETHATRSFPGDSLARQ